MGRGGRQPELRGGTAVSGGGGTVGSGGGGTGGSGATLPLLAGRHDLPMPMYCVPPLPSQSCMSRGTPGGLVVYARSHEPSRRRTMREFSRYSGGRGSAPLTFAHSAACRHSSSPSSNSPARHCTADAFARVYGPGRRPRGRTPAPGTPEQCQTGGLAGTCCSSSRSRCRSKSRELNSERRMGHSPMSSVLDSLGGRTARPQPGAPA